MVSVELEHSPVTESIGARVDGVALGPDLSGDTITAIRSLLLDRVVLVFPAQDLTPDDQIAFTERFGAVEPHPLAVRPGTDPSGRCIVLENRPGCRGARNDYWHSDISCAETPPAFTVLHAVTVPDGRGDTMFANMYRAWELLSPALQDMIRPLTAEHSGESIKRRNTEAETDSPPDIVVPPPATHPVVRRHGETGRAAVFTNTWFTTRFTGMTRAESRPLIELLEQIATRHDNVYRHRWADGDVLMWDNRATVHYAHYDYEPDAYRRMHRTTTAGERPIAA